MRLTGNRVNDYIDCLKYRLGAYVEGEIVTLKDLLIRTIDECNLEVAITVRFVKLPMSFRACDWK